MVMYPWSRRKDNSSPNPTISLPVTSSGDFAELKESSPPLPEPVIETDYAEDDAYNVSPYKETTESNNEEQDNSGITLQLEENSNSCHDRNMSVGQSWQLSNSTNEESTITTEIKKENESDEPQQERVVPVPIIPPTQQTTLPVLVTWPVPTNLVKNKVQLGPDGSAQNALLQKLKAVVQQNQQKATGQVPTVTQRTNQILVPIQSLSGTKIQLPISVHTPPTSQQLYSVQQTRPIVHLQPSTIVQQTRPIVQLQPSTIVQQTRPIVQLQPSAILSFQQPAPQRSTETTQVLASTSTSATSQASGSLSTNEQFLNPQLIKTEPTHDQSAGSGEPPVVPSTSTQQEEVDTGQSDSNDISEDEPKKKRFKSVQINTDEEGTSLGKSTIKNTRWGVKILQVPCEVNSSDDELLSTDNSDELDNAQTSSIGCESQKLDERLRQPASEKPTLEVPGTAVSTSEPVQKRFKTVSKEEMERLFVARQAPTTKKNTIWGMKIFQEKKMRLVPYLKPITQRNAVISEKKMRLVPYLKPSTQRNAVISDNQKSSEEDDDDDDDRSVEFPIQKMTQKVRNKDNRSNSKEAHTKKSNSNEKVRKSEISEQEENLPKLKAYFENIHVETYEKINGNRNYKKTDYCCFCKELYDSKILRHILSVHKNESKVKEVQALALYSVERKMALQKLRTEGNYYHNLEDELKLVADHLSHTVAIHTDTHRLQNSLLELTKVARALVALEAGKLGNFKGRSLSSISIDELTKPVAEDDNKGDVDEVNVVDELENIDKRPCTAADTELSTTLNSNQHKCSSSDNYFKENGEELDSEMSSTEDECVQQKCSTPCNDQSSTVTVDTSVQQKYSKPCNDPSVVKKPKQNESRGIKRNRWTTEEDTELMKAFSTNIQNKKNPTTREIRIARLKFKNLGNRTEAVIRSKINNVILGKTQLHV
ncbi:hypothetical protein KUTeg_010942 [Tegillarca granosa]|uniref:Uncharacterized protein n=1 Tax=Tegillarca granosa TaxID=220873 RepID=A0ABQ9F2H5_TEGGR|nr:hypothetical protein KUTeg_010942 [Tegillarca granosa]